VREKYCWLVAGGWFVLREKYCWLVADKSNEQAEPSPPQYHLHIRPAHVIDLIGTILFPHINTYMSGFLRFS
jgi:hypothetical protein